jgi:YaiO family outer membrane protein
MNLLPVAILSALLASAPQAQPPDQRAQAERFARSGDHARALREFQALAAANPDDIAARIWVARLHDWMGHPERAIDVYQSIIATEPQNVDALVGLGSALTRVGRLADASDALNRAEAIAADRPAVLAAQGRLHAAAGRSTLALAYFVRALAIEPGDRSTRDDYNALRARRAHRVEGSYYFEHFNSSAPETHAGILEVNIRVIDAVRLFANGQHQRKFSSDEDRFGAGIEWLPGGNTHIRLGGMFGSNTILLPDADASLDAEYRAGLVAWLGSVRYLQFDAPSGLPSRRNHSAIVSPGVTYWATNRLAATLRYYRSQTDLGGNRGDEGNNGFSARATVRVGTGVWLHAGYARGFESQPIVTRERLFQPDADSASAGIRIDPGPMTSLAATYEHQWWTAATRVNTLLVMLTQRF